MSAGAGPALAWSGGKDSALALWALRERGIDPAALMTTVTSGYERVSMHGVRRSLVRRQAAATGIPLVEIEMPAACTNDVYEQRMAEAFVVCVDPRALDPSFAGRDYDERLLCDLPPGVDPCGENGEFHTFVTAGPVLSAPVACRRGEVVVRDGFVFADLLEAG